MSAKTIIIGASGGTGAALAKKLKEQGHNLFLTARNKDDLPDIEAETAVLDVTDADQVKEVIEGADDGDGILGLAYCVGSIVLKPLKSAKDDDFLQAYEMNVLGAVRALRAAEKGLKKAGGSVVLFSTVAVQQGFNQHSVIASAKGGVEALGRSLAAEWSPDVRVNVIAPSLTDTKMAQHILSSDQMRKGIADMHPVSRLGQPEDQAAMAAFLLGKEAGWITGQVMGVDGGRSTLRTKG